MFKNTVVKAPAGSGKTTALVERYLKLLESGKSINEIIAITFTNKAAGEILERILERLLKESPELLKKDYFSRHSDFRISTIHSFLKNLLLVIDPFAASNYQVITESEDNELFLMVYYRYLVSQRKSYTFLPLLSEKRRELLFNTLRINAPISNVWAESILNQRGNYSDEEILQKFLVETARFYLEIYKVYSQEKDAKGLLTYADMVYKAYELMKEDHELRNDLLAAFNEKITAILIDEFQDTDYLQWETIKLLAEDWLAGKGLREVEDASIFIIGDPMQSIYGFRGADPGILTSILDDFAAKASTEEGKEHFEVITRDKNYRSLPAIVNFVNALFVDYFCDTSTPYDPFKAVREDRLRIGEVVIAGLESNFSSAAEFIDAEAEYIASKIKAIVGNELIYDGDVARKIRYEDIAVLLKVAKNISVFEEKLAEYGIPYLSEESGYTSLKPFEFLRTFFLLFDPLNGQAYLPKLLHFIDECSSRYKSLEDLRRKACSPVILISHAYERFKAFLRTDLFLAFKEVVKILKPLLYEKFRSEQEILVHSINLFEEIFYSLEKQGISSAFELVKAFQEKIAELTPKISHELNAVSIMTIHKAKGLEFPVVFVANLHSSQKNVSFDIFTSPAGTGEKYKLFISKAKAEHFYYNDLAKQLEKALEKYNQQMQHLYKIKLEEEEKRLFYVAFTRARDKLFISLPAREKRTTDAYKKLLRAVKSLDESLFLKEDLEEDLSKAPKKTFEFETVEPSSEASNKTVLENEFYDFTQLLNRIGYEKTTVKRMLQKTSPPSRRLEVERKVQPDVVVGKLVHEAIAEYGQGFKTRDDCLVHLKTKLENMGLDAELTEKALTAVQKIMDWLEKEVLPSPLKEFELPFVLVVDENEFKEGRMDLLYADSENTLKVVDFKFQEEGQNAYEEYAPQLENYLAAVKAIFKEREVSAELKFLR
jgi:ATP-dependent exoDNAse (exonuclease V) beta subunit